MSNSHIPFDMNNFSRDNGLWFENGKLYTGTLIYGPPAGCLNGFIKCNVKNGLREGLSEIFISDEQLWIKEYYKEGELHGTSTMYDRDDSNFAEKISNYSNGQLHGVSKVFWDKDTLSEISE